MDENKLKDKVDILDSEKDSNPEGQEHKRHLVDSPDVEYTPGEAAEYLNISTERLRYIRKEYEEFLPDLTLTGGRHARFHASDIKQLEFIEKLSKNHSSAEIKSILKDPEIKILYMNSSDRMSELQNMLIKSESASKELLSKQMSEFLLNIQNLFNEQALLNQEAEKKLDDMSSKMDLILKENQILRAEIEQLNTSKSDSGRGFLGLFKRKK